MAWIKCPPGVGAITVERQHFSTEATDEEGRAYFRVPDHFCPSVMSTGLGFAISDPPAGTDLPDLPQADPLRDGAIAEGLQKVQALEAQVTDQNMELGALRARLAETLHERDALKLEVHELTQRVTELEEEAEELREAAPAGVRKK